jgi:hypothetical protein
MESAQESMQSPAVLGAARELYSALTSNDFTEEQKASIIFSYTALVISVAADNASIAVLGKDVVDSMSEEYEELIKMMEESND